MVVMMMVMMVMMIIIIIIIIIRDYIQGTCVLIDVTIPGDRNVIKREAEMIVRYKDLTVENQRMWNVKAKVIPGLIGATAAISVSLGEYLSNIPGKHEIKELQKKPYCAHCGKC
jgi:hypothetical protein